MSKFRIKPYNHPICQYEIQERVLGIFWLHVTMASSFHEAERIVKLMMNKKQTSYY